jgi:hypothetical protein
MTMPQQGRRIERLTDKGQLVNNLLICAAQLAKYRAGTKVCRGSYLSANHSAGADHERSEAWKWGAAARSERLTRLVRDRLHCVRSVACDVVTVAGCRSLKDPVEGVALRGCHDQPSRRFDCRVADLQRQTSLLRVCK